MCNDGPQLSVKWYYAQGNKQVGPVPTAELIRLFRGVSWATTWFVKEWPNG